MLSSGEPRVSQSSKAQSFRALHDGPRAFIIPNPWDVGSARLLDQLGFEALATTSAGHAFGEGMPDGAVRRDAMLLHVGAIAAATNLPVSADLQHGYGETPAMVAETMRLAAAAGVVGGSVEDVAPGHDAPYTIAAAVDRVRAAVEAVAGLPFPFTLTARSENYLLGRADLADTIARLQAYQEAGADVLYAPGLTRIDDLATIVRAVDRPVNALATAMFTVQALEHAGVRRISVGSALSRAALGAALRGAREMREHGTFAFMADAEPYGALQSAFARR
jgi:2-methylisocitrate lyase-like PEP mutase family enzyme